MRPALVVAAVLGIVVGHSLLVGNFVLAGVIVIGLAFMALGVALVSTPRGRQGHAGITRNRGLGGCGDCSETGCWSVYCPNRQR